MAGYDLRKIFEEIELDLIHNLRRNMRRHDIEEQKDGFHWEMWQKAKLRNINRFRKENKDLVGSRTEQIDKTIEQSIRTSYKTGQTLFERAINVVKQLLTRKKPTLEVPKAVVNKILATVPDEQAFFGVNEKKIKALDTAIKKDITKGKNAIVRRMDDVYRQTLFKAEMYMATGSKTLDQAIDMATKDFLSSGIDCIEYKDGRRVNIASYAEMALRTMSHRATLVAEGQKRNEYGIYTVVVSAHANTCEKCAPWQGLVLIDDVFSNGKPVFGYPLLSTAIKMGLLHPNCRHTISTFFPGISKLPVIPDAEQAIALNDAEQKQREIERNIRKWRRIAEGSIDHDNIKFAHGKIAEYQGRLKDHLADNSKLRRDPTRENTKGITSTVNTGKAYSYSNFDKEHLAKNEAELLPQFLSAQISDDKLTGYILNSKHPVGKHKALAFDKRLGYTDNNWKLLKDQFQDGISRYKCSMRKETEYGQPFEVAMIIKGANDKYAKVKTGWIIEKNNPPRMTTAYVDE